MKKCSLLLSLGLMVSLASSTTVFAAAPVVDGTDARSRVAPNQQANIMAELVLQISQLQQEVRQLRGQLEEQDYRLNQMAKQQRELYIDLDRRIESAGVASSDTDTSALSSDASANSSDAQSAYNKAFLQYKDKKYAFAKSSFKKFIKDYPQEPLASNAHFWLGQLHMKDKEYAQAKAQFKSVYKDFPGANKKDVALLKLGQLSEQEGDKKSAKNYYQKVIAEHSGTTAAKLAKGKLEAL